MQPMASRARRHQRRHREKRAQTAITGQHYHPTIIFFTGAGLSAESGVPTFRNKGIWCNHENWCYSHANSMNTDLAGFLAFHNQRRQTMLEATPSQAHYLMALLQQKCTVRVITQNIDDLHERAGSREVLHLHGSIQFLVPKGFRSKKYRRLGMRMWRSVIAAHPQAHNYAQISCCLAKKFMSINKLVAGSARLIP